MREPFLAKILRWSINITAFMPLIIFSQYISPFHFGKVVIFRSIVEIMLVLYALLLMKDWSYRPRTGLVFWAFLAFTVAFSLTTLTSMQPYSSFWGSLERMGGLWTFLHYFVFFIIITSVLRTQKHWETFLNFTLVAGILSAFYGFGQKTHSTFFIGSGGRERIFGTIGNAALFAGYEIVISFLALTLYLRPGNSKFQKWLYGSAAVIGGLGVFMSVVRGSILGAGVGVIMMSLWYFFQTKSQLAKKAFLGFVGVTLLFIAILLTPIKNADFFQNSRVLHRLTDTSFDQFTAKTRFWAWEAGLKGWSESPSKILIGWGPENFNIPFSKYFNPKFFTGYGSETLFDRAHNMFVEILVTMGLVGFLTYVAIFLAAFYSLRKAKDLSPQNSVYMIGLSSLLVAYAIHNSFIFDTSANFLVFFSVLGFIAFLTYRGDQQNISLQPQPTRVPAPMRAITGAVLIMVASVLIYRTNVLQSKANYASTRAIIAGWSNDFAGSVAKFKEAMNYEVPGKYEIRHRFAQYLLESSNDSSRSIPGLEEALLAAIEVVEKNRDENKYDYLPELYLSRLNIILGRNDVSSPYNDRALEHSLKALEISPTFVRTYYEIGQAYLNKKDYDNAIKWFKRAGELNPDVGVSYWYWGIVELTKGNIDEGLRIVDLAFEKGYAASESDYLRLADLYAKRNDYRSLERIYEELIKMNPKNPQHFASLAFVKANLGKIDEALNAARQAVVLDPAFLPEAQRFAQQLGRTL